MSEEDRAVALALALQKGPPLSTSEAATDIARSCYFLSTTVQFRHLLGSEPGTHTKAFDKLWTAVNSTDELKRHIRKLILGSIGRAMLGISDSCGFRDNIDGEMCDAFVKDSLLGIFPFIIQANVDCAIEAYDENLRTAPSSKPSEDYDPMNPLPEPIKPLQNLNALSANSQFVSLFTTYVSSAQYQQALEDVERNSTSVQKYDFLLRTLFVLEYFRIRRTPKIMDSISNATCSHLFPVLRNTAQQIRLPGAMSIMGVSGLGQVSALSYGDSVEVFTKLGQIVQPLSALCVPGLSINSSMRPLTSSALQCMFPEQAAQVQELVFKLPDTLQPIPARLRQDWDTWFSRYRSATSSSISNEIVIERNHFDRNDGDFPERWTILEKGTAVVEQLIHLRYRGVNSFVDESEERYSPSDTWGRVDNDSGESPFKYKFDSARRRTCKWDVDRDIPLGTVRELPRYQQDVPQPTSSSSSSGCFAPGTIVWTDNGQRPIETLAENDRILTRASGDNGQYGVKSDEVVALPNEGGSSVLWGFNDQKAFFTRNHVFHTTTGLRAVDPVAAKLENPWLDVGKLRIGHTLLRTMDGANYEYETIICFTKEVIQCDHVWGIHLREGLRSYHANGYLVHLNYPEITIKSLADLLKEVPADRRVEMLGHLKELKPIFQKFGGGTVEQLLLRELADDKFLATARHKMSADELPPPPLYFQSRSYDVSIDPEAEKSEGVFDDVDALDGVLYVNGQPCTRSRILERGFAWSRPISESMWEHGMCTFGADKQLMNGDGLIWIMPDENPTKTELQPVRFQVQSITLRSRYTDVSEDPALYAAAAAAPGEPEMAYEESKTEPVEDGAAYAAPTNGYDFVSYEEAKPEPRTTSTDAEDSLIDDYIDGNFPGTVIGNEDAAKEKDKLLEKVEGPAPKEPESSQVTPVVDQVWDTYYDPVVFDGKLTTPPKITQPFLTMKRGLCGGISDAKTTKYWFDELEIIAEERQRVLKLDKTPEYQTQMFVASENNEMDVAITVKDPAALALAADNNTVMDEAGILKPKSFENLTYTTSKGTFTLPFIFSKYQIKPNTLTGRFAGKFCRFDPKPEDSVEGDGNRYLCAGKLKFVAPAPSVTGDSSKSPAAPSQPGTPAPITGGQNTRVKSVVNLISNLGVKSEEIKKGVRTLLYNAMMYHMDTGDREKFTNSNKPRVSDDENFTDAVPSMLADYLDDDLKKWIRDTYCIAFITNNLSQLSESKQKELKAEFNAKEIKKLQYWYHGKGRNCLSRSKEYDRLNTIASSLAFRRHVPKIMEYIYDTEKCDVIDDKGNAIARQNGGKKWAYLYYEQVSRLNYIQQIADQSAYTEFTGLNPLEHHVTVLSSLWYEPSADSMSGAKLGSLLAGTVNRYAKENNLLRHALIEGTETLESGLRDFFAGFLEVLLDEAKSAEAGLKPGIRQKLMDALEKMQGEKIAVGKELREKQKIALTLGAAAAIKSMASTIQDTVYAGGKGLSWIGRFARSIFGKDKPAAVPSGPVDPSKVGLKTKITAGLGLALTLAGTAYFIYSSLDSWGQWDDMSGVDRAKLVSGTIQAAGGAIYGTYRSIAMYKGWNTANPATAEMAQNATAQLEGVVRKRANALTPRLAEQARNPGTRQRANAISINKLNGTAVRPRNVSEAMLNARKPSSWNRFKASAQNAKTWVGKHMKFNVTEMTMRSFAVVLSVVMLVLACISAALNWNSLGTAEKWLTVVSLIVTLVAVILEIVVLFACISPLWSIGIALVGLIVGGILAWLGGKRELPKGDVQIFFEDKAKKFLNNLSDPPPSTFDWKLTNSNGRAGEVTTVEITGTARPSGDRSNLLSNLQSVRVAFHAGAGQNGALFDSADNFEEIESTQSLDTNKASITYPSKVKDDFDSACMRLITPGSNMMQYSCLVNQRDYGGLKEKYKGANVPFLDGLEPITIKVRGKLGAAGKYTLNINETYATEDGTAGETVETSVEFEKT